MARDDVLRLVGIDPDEKLLGGKRKRRHGYRAARARRKLRTFEQGRDPKAAHILDSVQPSWSGQFGGSYPTTSDY